MTNDDLVQRVYREFGPHPVPPERQAELYVDLDEVRGTMHAVSRLKERIRLAEGKPTCQVLAGHNGSGKSTELLRLKKQLEQSPNPFFVVYVKADEDVDRNDVDFPDVLVAIIRQMAKQLSERESIRLTPGLFKGCFLRFGEILRSEINFESFELGASFLKVAGKIKGSPDARREIRTILESDADSWLNAANDVIGQATLELTKQGKAGLVVLMDDLDKMIVRQHHDHCTTDENLFINRAAQLTAFACHVVYTIPLSLAYSHHEQAIKSSYGGHVPVVPMSKTVTRPPKMVPYAAGVEKFRNIIARRLQAANASNEEVFENDKACRQLIGLSAGQPDRLMMLVREAIVTGGLPISKYALDRAEQEGKREFARLLREDHWPVIDEVARTGTVKRTGKKEEAFRELLQCRAVLQYVNDDEWYGVNPMVAALMPKRRAKRKP